MPLWGATTFPEPATAKAFGVQVLYSYVMVWVIFVGIFVCVSVALLMSASFHCRLNKGWQPLELLFTLVPISILLSLVCPSAVSLYWTDSFFVKTEPHVSVKVTGHQWYWEYEVCQSVAVEQGEDGSYNFQEGGWLEEDVDDDDIHFLMLDNGESFESRIVGLGVTLEKAIIPEQVAVDNPLVLPWGVPIKFLFTSADVIHSWFVGALGVKVDATPGRISSYETLITSTGLFHGVCSELCGNYHGYMPVGLEMVSPETFLGYMMGLSDEVFFEEAKEIPDAQKMAVQMKEVMMKEATMDSAMNSVVEPLVEAVMEAAMMDDDEGEGGVAVTEELGLIAGGGIGLSEGGEGSSDKSGGGNLGGPELLLVEDKKDL